MTPRDVEQLTDLEYQVFWEVLEDHVRDSERERKRAERQARRRRH